MKPEPYRRSITDVVDALASPDTGLTRSEAERRRAESGSNEIADAARRSALAIFLDQFREVLIWVLLAAASISVFLGDWVETVAILAIVVLSAVVGFVQEYRAEEAMAALQAMAAPHVPVRRDGAVADVATRDLVPGDRVVLEAGMVVPADGRLVSAANLSVEEATLTGESEPVHKDADVVLDDGDHPVAERPNMVFMGTVVTRGRGELVVTGTGMATELGRIADLLGGVEDDGTPLQRRLDQLGRMLAVAAGALVVVVFVLGLLRGEDLEVLLLTSVSLAVAAIPEAMTAVVTIALSLGARRMLQRNALIRRLPAVETLGSVDVICSDKTGTLTQNRMTMVVVDIADRRVDVEAVDDTTDEALDLTLLAALLCNDAEPVVDDDGAVAARGEPTEAALMVAATGAGFDKHEVDGVLPRVAEASFASDRKRMTTVHRSAPGPTPSGLERLDGVFGGEVPPIVGFTKGAVTSLLDVADRVWVHGEVTGLDDEWDTRIREAERSLAADGKRVLGLAVRAHDDVPDPDDMERDLVFVGMVGLIDPPRDEVLDAVASARSAGIRPVMITGDHALTARTIARDVGIVDDLDAEVLTGVDLDRLDADGFARAAREVSVFARVDPEHKLRLVEALQADGRLVAMTGDGVNDAPALKMADIGVAMGVTGTDVTKQASDMILLDDNFATIVSAVEEGRVIYDNIRKFIRYLLTCNASELAVMIVGPILGMPLPLLPLQILWMNLVTDGLPALALGVEPAEDDVMRRGPRRGDESVFGGGTIGFITAFGLLLSAVSLAVGFVLWRSGADDWQSVLFTVLIFAQLGLALEVRSDHTPLWRHLGGNPAMLAAVAAGLAGHLAIIYVPFLQRVFGTRSLSVNHLLLAGGAALVVMVAVEVWKVVIRRRLGAGDATASG